MAAPSPTLYRITGLLLLSVLLLIILKGAGRLPVASWSWWQVTAPLWLTWLFALALVLLAGSVVLLIRTVRR